MTREMSHDEARALLAAEVLDALSADERGALEAHAAGCSECQGELAAFRDAVGALALAVPQMPMDAMRSSRLRARLVARAAADRQGTYAGRAGGPGGAAGQTPVVPLRPRATAPPRLNTARMLAAAALILVVVGIGTLGVTQKRRGDRLEQHIGVLLAGQREMQKEIGEKDELLAQITGPGVQVIDASSSNARQPSARMFWDQSSNRWTFFAHNLPETKQGRTYQLWLITKDKHKLSAGTFSPNPTGDALVQATYALPRDSLLAIAVTEEPAGGSPQPTSQPFLLGAAGKTE
jgi:anti-sigma-K factor RskA